MNPRVPFATTSLSLSPHCFTSGRAVNTSIPTEIDRPFDPTQNGRLRVRLSPPSLTPLLSTSIFFYCSGRPFKAPWFLVPARGSGTSGPRGRVHRRRARCGSAQDGGPRQGRRCLDCLVQFKVDALLAFPLTFSACTPRFRSPAGCKGVLTRVSVLLRTWNTPAFHIRAFKWSEGYLARDVFSACRLESVSTHCSLTSTICYSCPSSCDGFIFPLLLYRC